MKKWILLILLISGCVGQGNIPVIYETFGVNIDVNPRIAYTGSILTVKASVENFGNKTYRNVFVEMFDDGALDTHDECRVLFFDMMGRIRKLPILRPKQVVNLIPCRINLPSYIDQDRIETLFKFRAGFLTDLEALQIIPVISQTLKERGGYEQYPSKYYYEDGNIRVEISFNQDLPLVARREESCGVEDAPFAQRESCRYFMYITIRNIGPGFVSDLKGSDIRFLEQPPGIIKYCDFNKDENFMLKRNEFRAITCELNPEAFKEIPGLMGPINYIYNFNIILNVYYRYEIRKEIPIVVLR